MVELELQGKPIRRDFPNLKFEPSNVQLRNYTGDLTPVLGKAIVNVRYKDKQFELPLLATQGDDLNLLEASNLSAFSIADICSVSDLQQPMPAPLYVF